MRNSIWLGAALLIGIAGAVWADEPPKKFDVDRLLNSEPDRQLAAALQFNAEVRLAENKFRDAEAELKRTRLAVANKVQTLRTERDKARDTIGQADEKLQDGNLPADRRKAFEESRAKAIAIESAKNQELTTALGVSPLMPAEAPASPFYVERRHQSAPLTNPREQLPKDLVAQLDKDLACKLNFEEGFEMPLPLGLVELQKKANTKIAIQTRFQTDQGDGALKIEFKIPKGEGMTLGTALLWIEDQTEIEIYVREYGLLLAPRENSVGGILIPLREFLRK